MTHSENKWTDRLTDRLEKTPHAGCFGARMQIHPCFIQSVSAFGFLSPQRGGKARQGSPKWRTMASTSDFRKVRRLGL